MTISYTHRISAKNIPHVVTAASKSPFMRGPGTQSLHTAPDDIPNSTDQEIMPKIHIDVDPMIEDAWEAAKTCIEV